MLKLIIFLRPYAGYLLISWLLTIIIVSSIPSIPTLKIYTAKSEIRLDYLIHFCVYGALAFLANLSFAGDGFRVPFRKYVLITICLVFYAFADEFHQKLIPGRAFNMNDIFSNLAGIAAGLVFCIVVFRRIKQIKNS
jgi:VanZ family protein